MLIHLTSKVPSKVDKNKIEELTLIQGDIWLLIHWMILNGEIQVPPNLDLHLYVDDVEIPKPPEMEDDT